MSEFTGRSERGRLLLSGRKSGTGVWRLNAKFVRGKGNYHIETRGGTFREAMADMVKRIEALEASSEVDALIEDVERSWPTDRDLEGAGCDVKGTEVGEL